MKKLILILSLLILGKTQAQQTIDKANFQDVVHAYMDYFQGYDPLAPESVRKARFNAIVNKENPNLSQTDRERAFKIVDAYIRADKGLDSDFKISDEDKQLIENMWSDAERQKQKGVRAMNEEINRYKSMSYNGYKAFITQNGSLGLPENEIQKAYNAMHKTDGKQVSITQKNTLKLDMVQAIDILREANKHTYQEFKAAMLVIKPDISEEEIQKAWSNR